MNSPAKPDPWIGHLIGDRQRYRIENRLGAGGMGDVFLAMDTLLGQQVALKLIKDTLDTEELRKRFNWEVAVSAALKSDNIVNLSDYGITPEGHPFYVMEYLRGQSLGQLLRKVKQLSVERTVSIISQVCEGLRFAHEGVTLWRDGALAGEYVKVVHRDLKPDNIFLVPTVLGELVKILDFGIAKILHDAAEYTNFTRMFIGTFRYASPEQLAVQQDLDGRADIYSLGVILYEMLSGTDPFGLGLNTNRISEATWAIAHTTKQPQPMSSLPGCEELSPELEAVVMRCLQKSPGDRFATVDELKRALQASATRGSAASGTANPQSLTPSGQGVNITSAQTPPSLDQSLFDSTVVIPVKPSGQGANTTSEKTRSLPRPSNFLPFRKTPLLLIGSGIAIVVAVGIYYWPQLSGQPIVTEKRPPAEKPIVAEPKFSLANTLAGHTDSVWSLAISPDGQTLVSGSEDKTIKIWSLGDGKLLRSLSGHTDAVRFVAISPDGQTLVSGSGDTTIKIWNLRTGELLRTLSGHTNTVWSLAISPDGQTLVSGSQDRTIKIWNLSSGKLLRTLSGHTDTVYSIALSPNGQTFASGSQDKTIKIWRLDTGALLGTLSGQGDTVRSIAISPDGQTLASGIWDKTIKIWNLNNRQLVRTLSGHTERVVAIAMSQDGQNLVSTSLDRTIKIWRLNTGELLDTLSEHSDWVLSVALSPDGQTIVSGSKDKTIKIWRR